MFAEEVRETRTKAAAPETNADARAAAEAQAAADEALVSALKAMGIADDALPEDDLEDMDDDAGESDAEGEAPDPEQAELPIIDTTATEVSDDIAAAEKHEALQGAAKKPRGGRKAPTNRADGGGK